METTNKLLTYIVNFLKWGGGLVEDQKNSASSKRAVLYLFCYMFYMQVKASIDGLKIDNYVLFATVGVIAFLIGAVTSEFFNKFIDKK